MLNLKCSLFCYTVKTKISTITAIFCFPITGLIHHKNPVVKLVGLSELRQRTLTPLCPSDD